MRTSHFASIQVLVPPEDYVPVDGTETVEYDSVLKTVGMAQSINIDDNFGTRSENMIGTPLPVIAPGYQVTNVRMEKATIDGSDFRNLGAFNPLWAHVGSTYQESNYVNVTETDINAENPDMYPFMFVLTVKNRVSDSYSDSNIATNNQAVERTDAEARSNPFGTYVCVLESASISMTSQQVVVMDSISAVARPLTGNWFNSAIRDAYSENGDATNGMRDIVNSIMFGYRPPEFS